MLIERPPLLRLGAEEAFDAYRKEFARLYQSDSVFDVLGRLVEFPQSAARHVCFKSADEDSYRHWPREVWSQERAERIPWILCALQAPTEIRPDQNHPDTRQVFLLTIPADPQSAQPQERYAVYVETIEGNTVVFVTGFDMRETYWVDARNCGPRVLPAPKKPKAIKGKKRAGKRRGQGS